MKTATEQTFTYQKVWRAQRDWSEPWSFASLQRTLGCHFATFFYPQGPSVINKTLEMEKLLANAARDISGAFAARLCTLGIEFGLFEAM